MGFPVLKVVGAMPETPEPRDIATTHKPSLDQIQRLEAAIPYALPTYDIDKLTTHQFCPGMYARRLDIPKGACIVGKTHSSHNFFLLAVGEMTVSTDAGMVRIKGPFLSASKPGDKRVAYAHEDCITFNFHVNPDDEQDMILLEQRYILPEVQPSVPPADLHNLLQELQP
jgi:hypothetical protein